MLDWQDLHHLVMLGRLGTLAAVAKKLRVDHATVSRRIASLEKSAGLKLVVRLPKSSRLTEDGEALVTIASQMAETAEAVERYVRHAGSPLSGTVTISALPILASMVITPSLPRLRAQYPELKIILNATLTVASIARGEADIAISMVRPETPASIVRRIGHAHFGLYGAASMVSRAAPDWVFIGFEDTLSHIAQQVWLDKFAGEREFAFRSNDLATQLAAAQAGLGLALLPSRLAELYPGLLRIELKDDLAPRELWLSVHTDLRKSPAVRATMDHLIDAFEAVALN